MYYEINVSLNGQHFFATDKRSATSSGDAIKITSVFLDKFPQSEGYEISVSFHPESGRSVKGFNDDNLIEAINGLYY